jgi:hypothetical protein
MKELGSHSRPSSALTSIALHQASLRCVLDYLTHLYDRGYSWSTIGIHRSTLSMTMAPIDCIRVGHHPLIKKLMSDVFNKRPSRRANPALWDPLKVLSIFQHWPVDLPLSNLIRKGAFLIALTTAKRPTELVALLCDDNHFRWEGENLRFVPSRLTKTDHPGHLAPPPLLCQALEGGFMLLPVGDCKTHSIGKSLSTSPT